MRSRSALLLGLCLFAVLSTTRAPGATDEMSPEAAQAVEEVARAGWTGWGSSAWVGASAKQATWVSDALQEAVLRPDLSDSQRAALVDVVQLKVEKPVDYLGTRLEPGEYRFGLGSERGHLLFVLRRASSPDVICESTWWASGVSNTSPSVGVTAKGPRSEISVSFGEVAFVFRFLHAEDSDAVGASLATFESADERVRIRSDLPWSSGLTKLATQLEKGCQVYDRILGAKDPKPYEIYLLSKRDDYEKACRVIADGEFLRNGAFSSALSGRAYIHVPVVPESLLRGDEVPLFVVSLCLHELFHLSTYRAEINHALWPEWIAEGFAEWASVRALQKIDKKRAKEVSAEWDARFALFLGLGVVPPFEDLASWKNGLYLSLGYKTAAKICEAIADERGGIESLLASLREPGSEAKGDLRLRALIQERFEDPDTMLSKIRVRSKDPAPVAGRWDRSSEGWWRLYAPEERSGHVIAPKVHDKSKVTLRGSFSYLPHGTQQADILFGYRAGSRAESYYKVAVQPKLVALLHYSTRHGWRRLASLTYDEPLEAGTADEPLWHDWTLAIDEEEKVVRWDHANGRWAKFDIQEPFSLRGSRAGFGGYGTILYAKDWKD